ncbi:MAG: succinate dehydrogenase/fumarate reductase cytochrome b subunit [Deltaproteobacteria bacterium]|nr:succinate dehydrogenase/fumarate reductase cytochrome b subunit [Deltaproteobacteria bacterium]
MSGTRNNSGSDLKVIPGWPPVQVAASRVAARSEFAFALSGIGLAVFMVLHTGLLLSSHFSAAVMDELAFFLEWTYLLQIATPLLIVLILTHVVLASRKLPSTAPQQLALIRQVRVLGHFDSWLWILQIATGVGLLSLVSIHFWEVLTDLPIQAVKSGGRVREALFTFSAPFIVLVQAHLAAGLYRISVKWGVFARRWARVATAIWLALFLILDTAIILALYDVGGRP